MVQTKTIDEYIHSFPKDVQELLRALRELMREEVSGAEETISYGVPVFKRNGKYVVYFAAFKKHISIYPIISDMERTLPELTAYKKGRGTLQFPLDKPLPFPLIRKAVKILLEENKTRTLLR